MTSHRFLLLPFVAASAVACTGVDPGSPFAGDLASESSSETGLGTESGNPTGEASGPVGMLGTESGNPSDPPATEAPEGEQAGTESGNPTRPPPASEGEDVTVPVPIPEDSDPATDGAGPMTVDPPGAMSGGEPAMPETPVAPPPGSSEPGTGVAGEPTSSCEPTRCADEAAAFAAALGAETTAPAPLSSTSCSESGVCTCSRDDGTLTLTTGDAGSCLVRGRLACLYSADEYGGCTPADASICEAACSQVQARLEADAKGIPAAVRASGCGTSGCVYVLSVGDACFVAGSALAPVEIDCSLSDEEALNSR